MAIPLNKVDEFMMREYGHTTLIVALYTYRATIHTCSVAILLNKVDEFMVRDTCVYFVIFEVCISIPISCLHCREGCSRTCTVADLSKTVLGVVSRLLSEICWLHIQ